MAVHYICYALTPNSRVLIKTSVTNPHPLNILYTQIIFFKISSISTQRMFEIFIILRILGSNMDKKLKKKGTVIHCARENFAWLTKYEGFFLPGCF